MSEPGAGGNTLSDCDPKMKSITVGITGASGAIYAQRLLLRLNESRDVARINLVISKAGARVTGEELGLNVVGTERRVVAELIGSDSDKILLHPASDIGASIASGSHPVDAMVIVPCSMSTLACVAAGITRDLVQRAADVMLKESRPLLLVPRETPLHAIHLANMLKLARLGARIIPAMPSFYYHPRTIDDLVEHFTHRLLDHLGVAHEQRTRWEGSKPAGRRGEAETR
jgi:4-hydroxy-3-polyprenylbenzoate decarboxylase